MTDYNSGYWRGCINSSSSRRGADLRRRLHSSCSWGQQASNSSSSDAACSFASPSRGCPDVDGSDEPDISQREIGAATERIAEPAGHGIAALSSSAPSQSQPPRSSWGCTQVQFSPRSSARPQMVLILSLALAAAGGLHGVAAQQTCPTYTVTPAVQANCTTPTYDPTTCILRTWCLT